jgi:hypothetical protein
VLAAATVATAMLVGGDGRTQGSTLVLQKAEWKRSDRIPFEHNKKFTITLEGTGFTNNTGAACYYTPKGSAEKVAWKLHKKKPHGGGTRLTLVFIAKHSNDEQKKRKDDGTGEITITTTDPEGETDPRIVVDEEDGTEPCDP